MSTNTLAARTAWRYLFSRKSHSAVNAISIVSVCGIALATMAMICVLSVYNGFQDFLGDRAASIVPDVEIRPAKGKIIANADSLIGELATMKGVNTATSVVDDNMLLYYDNRMMPVRALGVDEDGYAATTDIKQLLTFGSVFSLRGETESKETEDTEIDMSTEVEEIAAEEFNETDLMVDADMLYADDEEMTSPSNGEATESVIISAEILQQVVGPAAEKAKVENLPELTILVPRRTATISTINPENALMVSNVKIAGAISADQSNYGSPIVLMDIDMARSLLEYNCEANTIYIKAGQSTDAKTLAAELQNRLGSDYKVSDRNGQLSMHFNMMRIEKWFTFLLLSFILLIASFNIISTLSMLIVDKRKNIEVMRRLGAPQSLVGEVFCWESFYVCFIGTIAGLIIGLILCYLQIHYGFISIPDAAGKLVIDKYPVAVRYGDILRLMVPSIAIAIITATISSRFARRSTAALHD